MSIQQPDLKETADKFMGYLRQLKNDRGAMANLRCALNPTKLYRAWPLLGRVSGIGNSRKETIAGLFAYHPDEAHTGNLGTTCQRLKEQNPSFDARFRRILACDREEICERLRPVILAAKTKGIPINYKQLFLDLCYWSETVRVRWAQEYWRAAESEEEVVENPEELTT